MSIDNQFIKQLNNNPFLFLGSQGDFWTNAVYEKYFDGCQIDSLSMRTDPDFGKFKFSEKTTEFVKI